MRRIIYLELEEFFNDFDTDNGLAFLTTSYEYNTNVLKWRRFDYNFEESKFQHLRLEYSY